MILERYYIVYKAYEMLQLHVNGNLKIELDSPTNNEICTLGWKVTNTWNDYVNDQFWIHSYALTNL